MTVLLGFAFPKPMSQEQAQKFDRFMERVQRLPDSMTTIRETHRAIMVSTTYSTPE